MFRQHFAARAIQSFYRCISGAICFISTLHSRHPCKHPRPLPPNACCSSRAHKEHEVPSQRGRFTAIFPRFISFENRLTRRTRHQARTCSCSRKECFGAIEEGYLFLFHLLVVVFGSHFFFRIAWRVAAAVKAARCSVLTNSSWSSRIARTRRPVSKTVLD